MMKRIALAMLAFVLLFCSTGCWGKTELNEIGIVTVTGIDTEPDGTVRISVLSIQPEGTQNSPQMRSITWLGTATGTNLVDAAKNLRSTAFKTLTWIHNHVILIGQEAAKDGMEEIIDFFSRNRELRFNSYMLVTEGRAYDMMQTPSKMQRDLFAEMQGLIRNVTDWSKCHVADAREFMISYSEHCGDLITGRIGYSEEEVNPFSTAREDVEKMAQLGQKLPVAYLEGCGVFKNGKFVGWLNTEETRGYLWITDKIKPGAVIAGGKSNSLALENKFASTSVKMKKEGENWTAVIKLDVRGTLMEQTTNDDIRKREVLISTEDSIEEVIKSEMDKAVKKIQKEYNVDVFRFGSNIQKHQPGEWKKIKKDWESTLFHNVKVEYDIEVTIERTGMLIKTLS